MNRNFLVLIRHGQSEWNKLNLFTGWKDPGLTNKGIKESEEAANKLNDFGITFDVMFTSKLIRAKDTGIKILKLLSQEDIPVVEDEALNERKYGDLTGLNKDEVRQKFGEKQVQIWRRSYNTAPPGGESLFDTYQRVIPYFKEIIVPEINARKNVLISAHGNSLRALRKYLENFSEDEIVNIEIGTGEPIFYTSTNGDIKKYDWV
jgi:2,3-bisphosphoglycerate-dependent phosphoglycerate mutase